MEIISEFSVLYATRSRVMYRIIKDIDGTFLIEEFDIATGKWKARYNCRFASLDCTFSSFQFRELFTNQ